MGIQDRDYYRDGSGGLFDSWGRQGVTFWLVVITSAVFLGQCVGGNPVRSPLVLYGALWSPGVMDGEVWRLVTPLFLHGGLLHLFANMLVLYFIGSRLEELYGGREFLTLYLVAGVFANALEVAAEELGLLRLAVGVGASGAISALVVIFAFHFPRVQILVFFILPMPMWVAAALFVAFDALGAMGVGRPGIGYFVHLGGALFGFIYYQTGFRFGRVFSRSPRDARTRFRPQLRVVPAEAPEPAPAAVGASVEPAQRAQDAPPPDGDDQIEARLDLILAKVSKFGQGSLTPEERDILVRASELYKKRRK